MDNIFIDNIHCDNLYLSTLDKTIKFIKASPTMPNTASNKLSLVSTLLFYTARDDLDLSQNVFMGMVEIIDEVVESIKSQQE